ncbi:MAG: hypothetical protein BMS9Abin18_0721 [Zetaproteobacteria bacterium]|nr:MAG: hypothetical protein BMS9Abin18_0721 [Zetaproteobacteria bacterium]
MPSLRQLIGTLRRPFQVMVLEPHGGKAVRRFNISIGRILLMMLILVLGSSVVTWFYAPHNVSSLPSRYYQLQQSNHDTSAKLAESEGELSLRDAQINALKAELKKAEQHADALTQRIRVYESILEARKSGGIRILRAKARWSNPGLITYDIVVVKSGNYPRRISGSLRLVARSSDGKEATLHLGKKAPELPYHMETHTFLHGSYAWNQDWRPDHLLIIHLNRQGKVREQTEIEIQGGTT